MIGVPTSASFAEKELELDRCLEYERSRTDRILRGERVLDYEEARAGTNVAIRDLLMAVRGGALAVESALRDYASRLRSMDVSSVIHDQGTLRDFVANGIERILDEHQGDDRYLQHLRKVERRLKEEIANIRQVAKETRYGEYASFNPDRSTVVRESSHYRGLMKRAEELEAFLSD